MPVKYVKWLTRELLHAWAGIVGRDGIKAMVWYRLSDGKPVEVVEAD